MPHAHQSEAQIMVATSNDVVRIMGVWVRRADAGLARGAARNAASSLAEDRRRSVDYARTLRELRDAERRTAPQTALDAAPPAP
jgi:hypothetical protein